MFCLFCSFLGEAQVDLSLKLKKGNIYTFSIVEKNTIIQVLKGTENRSINKLIGSYSYKILENWDSLYLIEARFNEFTQEIESSEENSSHSSTFSVAPDFMCTILKGIIDKPFKIVMDKEFTWKKVTGLDSIFFSTYAGINLPKENRRILDSTIKDLVGEFVDMGEISSLAIYPSKTIKPNEIWTTYSVTENIVPTYDTCNYYMAEVNGDDIVVKSDGRVHSVETEQTNEGLIISYHLSGKTSATTRFARNSGWIRQAEQQVEMEGYCNTREVKSNEKLQIPMKVRRELFITGY
jgi:Family of unknown function (DUF6263)